MLDNLRLPLLGMYYGPVLGSSMYQAFYLIELFYLEYVFLNQSNLLRDTPSILMVFVFNLLPLIIVTLDLGTPIVLETNSISPSFAFPSIGGRETLTFSIPFTDPQISSRPDLGRTLTSIVIEDCSWLKVKKHP